MRHEGPVKSMEVTSMKWAYIDKKKCYGNVRKKTKKYVCVRRNMNECMRPKFQTEEQTDIQSSEPTPENEFGDGNQQKGVILENILEHFESESSASGERGL